ncbi:MAG: DUF1549 domain-containing protein [Planctomycetaceae bacterium]
MAVDPPVFWCPRDPAMLLRCHSTLLFLFLFSSAAEAFQAPANQANAVPPTGRIPRGSGKINGPPVKSVDPARIADVKKSAAKIDEFIEANYKKHGVTGNAAINDAVFCRRVWLHLGGRIPKLEEVTQFLQSKDPEKRSRLIDQLLGSHDYVSHMFNFWANILRLQDHPINANQLAQPYHEWIKKSLAENTPYDQWVTRMITAEGRIWDDPAAGYSMRDSGMELDHMDNTVQVFLGTQIGCAQRHDHPFDRWTQKEFYQMAAYLYPTQTRVGVADKKRFPSGNPIERVRNEMKAIDPNYNVNGTFGRMLNANMFIVTENPLRRLKLPHDYQYDNAKADEAVTAKPIFGADAKINKGDSPKAVFAKWLTAPENPRFAKNIANRMWKKAFGIGLIEPANDIRDESECSNPELLDYLTSELIRLKYDVRELQRIICHTQTWQRGAQVREVTDEGLYQYPGPTLRRMTAEQLWDSLLTMAVYNFESFTRPTSDGLAKTIGLDLDKATAADVRKAAEDYEATFSSNAQRKLTQARNSYKNRTACWPRFRIAGAVACGSFSASVRAGDRELIEAANTDGNVSQILMMFNGEITHMMLDAGSVIFDDTVKAKTVNDRIDVIFLSILSRKATTSEETVAKAEIKDSGNAGYGNVIWALINTKEFLFIQ